MKKIAIVILLLISSVCISQAGEKEELQWRVRYYEEHMTALKSEATLTLKALAEAKAKLKVMEEKSSAEKDGKKVKEGSEKKGVKR